MIQSNGGQVTQTAVVVVGGGGQNAGTGIAGSTPTASIQAGSAAGLTEMRLAGWKMAAMAGLVAVLGLGYMV